MDSRRVRMAVFATGNCIAAPRPAPNTGSARGGTRAEHPEGHESRAHAAVREQSAPRAPQPQATTRIEQLNTQVMVAYKLADSCIAA